MCSRVHHIITAAAVAVSSRVYTAHAPVHIFPDGGENHLHNQKFTIFRRAKGASENVFDFIDLSVFVRDLVLSN